VEKTLLQTVTLQNYPRRIKLSNSIRTKYWLIKDRSKLPKKYLSKELVGKFQVQPGCVIGNKYIWKTHKKTSLKTEIRLADRETEEFIIRNPKVAGTARWITINGQKIYNAEYSPFTRQKIMKHIHDWMLLSLQALTPITTFPLYIECEVHDYKTDDIVVLSNWDIFNRAYPFCKAFEDVLQELRIIPDDTIDYVICPSHPIFIEIPSPHIFPYLQFNIYVVSI